MYIRDHPLHHHALHLRKLSEHCDFLECRVCGSRIHGSASIYCCERCDFYLHRSCTAGIPSQIRRHPLHPDHPLTLGTGDIRRYRGTAGVYFNQDGSYSCGLEALRCPACERRLHKCGYYCKSASSLCRPWGFYCSSCPFDLHVGCAMVSLLPDKESGPEQERFEHFAHECPLALLHVEQEYDMKCKACDLQLSGEVYGCRSCVFFLHKTCVEWPQEIRRHPFHSLHPLTLVFGREDLHCRACRRRVLAAYRCKDCRFDLCHDCANAAPPLGSLREETEDSRHPTDHFFHRHPLAFYCTEKEMPIRCEACNQQVSGEFYGCPGCSFFIHEPCLQSLSREIRHYLDTGHPLTFSRQTINLLDYYASPACDSCQDLFGNEEAYSCEECEINLHVPCALQTRAYLEQGASMTIENLIAEYELTLAHARGSRYYFCDSCGKHCHGPVYRCGNIMLHKSCAEALSNLNPFHHQHRLVLIGEPPSSDCNVCGESIKGRICYRCEDCSNFKLHLSCVQKPTIKHPLHAHGIVYFQRKRNPNLRCKACGMTCAVDLYSCEVCNVHIHYDCLQMPLTIKSKHHIDELTLHESIVEDDSGKYYCDICEQRRDPELWAYYCKVCELIAHVVCVVSPVKEKPALEQVDQEIEGVQQEVDEMKASVEELTANLEKLSVNLRASQEKLEALKKEKAQLVNI